jgi:hypothetical protein
MPNTPREVHTRLSSLRLSPTRETEIVDELEQAVRSHNLDLSLTTAQTLEEIQAHAMAHTSSAVGCDVCGNAQRHAAKERIELVSQTFASWNHVARLLLRIHALPQAA